MANKVQPKLTGKELSTNNYIAAIVVVIVLVVLVVGFIGNWLVPQLILNTKVIQKKIQAKQDVDTKYDNAKSLLTAYDQLGGKVQLIDNALPNTADFAQLLTIMENISNVSSVKLKSVTPSLAQAGAGTATVSTASGFQSTRFTIAVEGQYDQVMTAIKNIEKSVRPLRIVQADIKGGGNQVQVNLTIETYFQPKADITDKTEVVK